MKIRTGIIGIGSMGQGHLKTLLNDVPACEVVAVCDIDENRLTEAMGKGLLDVNIRQFTSYTELIDSGSCDAVIVVTPHPLHPEISIYAFGKGLHVLCDKPVAITVSGAEKMIAAWKKSKVKFSTMYSMRSTAVNKVIKDWIAQGRLGKINRVDMVCTKWLRSQKYYDEQTWRGTWKGEGAGLLLNQAPHNLDLLYWWFGPADAISAQASTRFHNIETEDEVEARIKTKAGFPVRFYSSTGEAPGMDRIEIVGTNGTLVKDGSTLVFHELENASDNVIGESAKGMVEIPCTVKNVEVPQAERGHKIVFRDFFDAIISNRENSGMISPGDEGIHSLEWANAMLMSSVEGREIKLPLDRKKYDKLLDDLINWGKKL
jgi:predicted dehydrogenase